MTIMEEIVTFRRPLLREQVLFVRGLPVALTWESKWSQLVKAFSLYGLLYSVHVPSGSNVGYAIIQYYSIKSAFAALHSTNNKLTIGQARIKVNLYTLPNC